jgi:hypothetical protein
MDFGGAIHCMFGGDAVHRDAWARGVYLKLEKPDDHSQMTRPYIYITESNGSAVPWVATHEDMLASDWSMGTGE